MNKYRIDRNDSILVIIDAQERLVPPMFNPEEYEDTLCKLARGLKILQVPALVTTQYAKGLGDTTPKVCEAVGEFTPIDKTTFSAYGSEEFVKALEASGKKTVILCGAEAHVCLQQTALELLDAGYKVVLPEDCISSRKKADRDVAMRRMELAGCIPTTYESILFEFAVNAKAPGFKDISAIVK